MKNPTTVYMPHEKLVAYQVACDLVVAVRDAQIRDADLRDQAMRSARSTVLNICEANGRVSMADRKRVFGIARGEATECVGALQLGVLTGECSPAAAARVRPGAGSASRAG